MGPRSSSPMMAQIRASSWRSNSSTLRMARKSSTQATLSMETSMTASPMTSAKTGWQRLRTAPISSRRVLGQIEKAIDAGVVLVMSLWDDHYANMLWLDSTYPVDSTDPGAARGTCSTDSGVPADVEKEQADSSVI